MPPIARSNTEKKRKGERRIVVDGVTYHWRIPRRANTSQEDQDYGVFAVVRRDDEARAKLTIFFPQMHGSGEPITPSDIARGIRKAIADGWKPKAAGRVRM